MRADYLKVVRKCRCLCLSEKDWQVSRFWYFEFVLLSFFFGDNLKWGNMRMSQYYYFLKNEDAENNFLFFLLT